MCGVYSDKTCVKFKKSLLAFQCAQVSRNLFLLLIWERYFDVWLFVCVWVVELGGRGQKEIMGYMLGKK